MTTVIYSIVLSLAFFFQLYFDVIYIDDQLDDISKDKDIYRETSFEKYSFWGFLDVE